MTDHTTTRRSIPGSRRLAVVGVLVVALAAAACGGSGGRNDSSSGSDDTDRVVRLVTYDSFALPEDAAAEERGA